MKRRKVFMYSALTCILILLFTVSFYIYFSLHKNRAVNSTVVKPPVAQEELPEPAPIPEKPVVKDVEPPQNTEILVSSAGDCTLGTDDKFYKPASLPAILQNNNNDYSYFFKNVADIFKADDITTVNLETTFTQSNEKRADRQFNFKGNPELAKSLPLGSIEGVTLSNNHIYDYNQKGFNDTIKALKDNNINYFGEGNRWITTVKGIKFGFLGYTGWSNDKSFLNGMKKDIQELKSQNCIVIINIHWGDEGQYNPNAVQKSIGHFAIDNGADIVIGHHPHVIQGVEKYKDRFICYSMANFCFGGNSNPTDKDTFIFQSNFKFVDGKLDSLGVRAIPCSVSSVTGRNDYCPTPLKADAKNRFLDKLNKLSINLGFRLSEDFHYIKVK